MKIPLMPYEKLKEELEGIPNREHMVFLMLTYVTLGRVGEIVKGRYAENPPLTSEAIIPTEDGKHIIITVLSEKIDRVRKIPVSREKESWLTEPILSYAADLPGPLFSYSTRWGEKVFAKYFDGSQNIHALRSWRATHLLQGAVTGKPLSMNIVRKMGGWLRIDTLARYYDFSIVEDYIDEI